MVINRLLFELNNFSLILRNYDTKNTSNLNTLKMIKNIFFSAIVLLAFVGCSDEDSIDVTVYNPELSIVENLDNEVTVLNIVAQVGVTPFYGLEYGGGFIFHVNETSGTALVATDYSEAGIFAWGDIFDLDTNSIIGSGLENTQQIINGNANDNSATGFEHDGDYALAFTLIEL